MTQINEIILIVVLGGTSFFVGRMLAPVKVETKTVYVDKIIEAKRKIKTIIVEKPSGEKTTVITEDTNVSSHTKSKENDVVKVNEKSSKISLSFLMSAITPKDIPTYGVYASKEIAGPITIGVWGLLNGNYGVSVGLNF